MPLLAIGLVGALGMGLSESQSASDDPVYYVDGARPRPGADSGSEDAISSGCVPWSKARPDVFICGPIPSDFEPAAAPGDYATYTSVCDAGAAIFEGQAENLVVAYGLPTAPTIDVKSCGAWGLGSQADQRWTVKFTLANADSVTPYVSARVRDFTVVGDGSAGGTASISEEPW